MKVQKCKLTNQWYATGIAHGLEIMVDGKNYNDARLNYLTEVNTIRAMHRNPTSSSKMPARAFSGGKYYDVTRA